MINLDSVNSLLSKMAEANGGTNHSLHYALAKLPTAESLPLALDAYFSSYSTSSCPPQPPERWNIRTTELSNADSELRSAAKRWFYEMECSPFADSTTLERTLNVFLNRLQSVVGNAKALEVKVDPPMWYECEWQDFAFDGESGRWMLHFGVSD